MDYAWLSRPDVMVAVCPSDRQCGTLPLPIVQGSHVLDLSPEVTPEAAGLFKVTYTFLGRGTYAVHVRRNGDYLFTYEVRVGRRGTISPG